MAIMREIIIKKAPRIEWHPKKLNDHKILRTSCKRNTPRASLMRGLARSFLYTRNAEIPIMVNNTGQTTVKTQFAGAKDGFLINAYHCESESYVKNPPTIPASWQMNILISNLKIFFIYYAKRKVLAM